MKALIIGGGIGGLTTAIALRRRGIDADVYESTRELRDVGAGISLWANATKALRKLGLGAALDAAGRVNQLGALRQWNGRMLSRMPTQELERRFGAGVVVLHRAELLDALARTVGAADIHLGRACVGIEEDAEGVTARFSDGTVARGDLLIGADGIHSVVRTTLGHPTPIRYSGYTAWRAVVPFDDPAMVPGESWGRGQRFGIAPIHGGGVYWFATSNAPEGERDTAEGPQARLLRLFKGWHEPVEALIRATASSAILRNDIYDRDPLPTWGRGRVTLLGDAAHPMTPNLGQGACQAIEDALELATCLAGNTRVDLALKEYEARRVPRTRSVVLRSRQLGMIGQIESPILCSVRDAVMRMTPASLTLRSLAPVVGHDRHLADGKHPGASRLAAIDP